ncbi:MAG: OmpH family outer membrane protein [Caulobacteraceae bacterium]|nr:OmpH family outer membrane protein [Caulobacteraceae bacterium]
MKTTSYVAAATAALLVATQATSAFAQAAAAQPAAPQVTHGPATPGVCILSVEGAIAQSTVGRNVDARMKQIVAAVQAELNAEQTTIQNEGKTLESQRATLDQNTLQTRANAWQTKVNNFQRKAAQRDREVQATQQKALSRIGTELDPVIRQVYQQRQCGMLLSRDALVIANPQMDITPAVVTALNAKIQNFTFDREHLDQPAATPAAPR